MSSLPRCGFSSIESNRQLLNTYKMRNVNMKHRHYSSSKFIKTLVVNETKSLKIMQKESSTEAIEGALEKKELKRYCINRFRTGAQQQKIPLKRKNSSLKIFKKEDSFKTSQTKIEENRNQESNVSKREERGNNSLSRETLSSQTISVKRRVEILKIGRMNRPKLQIKDENLAKNKSKGDVSFQEKLMMPHFDEEPILSSQKIRSENILGRGLKKSSSTKIKVLVKNPFQRHLKPHKYHEPLASQVYPSIESINQLKESQIVQLDESSPSLEYQQDLQLLLAMM